jgi:lysophospholipase L1-like esterase
MRTPARLALSLAALLAALVLIEAGFRVLGPEVRPVDQRVTNLLLEDGTRLDVSSGRVPLTRRVDPAEDPVLANVQGVYLPGIRYEWCYDLSVGERRPSMDEAGCVAVELNEDSLRGPRVAPSPADDTVRIAAVGDSFTFGAGVSFEAAWPAQLERALAARAETLPGAPRPEVVNLGVPGYHAKDLAWWVRGKALPLEPHWVLYGFFLNDVFSAELSELDPDRAVIDLVALNERASGEPTGLARVSRFVDWMRKRDAGAELSALVHESYNEGFADGSPQWEAFARYLADMAESTRDAGMPLAVVLFPEIAGTAGAYPFEEVHRKVRALCDELGLPTVDVLDAWRGIPHHELWVHPTDHHPNERASRLAAEWIDAQLGERLLAPR